MRRDGGLAVWRLVFISVFSVVGRMRAKWLSAGRQLQGLRLRDRRGLPCGRGFEIRCSSIANPMVARVYGEVALLRP